MCDAIWAKAYRDALENRTRAALVVLALAVGVFGIGTLAGAYAILQRELARTISAVNPAQLLFDITPLDPDSLAAVEALPEVAAVEARSQVALSAAGPDRVARNLTLVALPSAAVPGINQVVAVSGAFPPAPGAVAIERASLPFLGVAQGDSLALTTADGTSATLVVSGVAADPWRQSPAIVQAAFGYVAPETLQAIGGGAPTTLLVQVAGDPRDPAALQRAADAVERTLLARGVEVQTSLLLPAGEHPAGGLVAALLLLLALFGALTLLLSTTLVSTTMHALLARQVRQVGVLKALGATTGQVLMLYAVTVSTLGAIAFLVALPLAAVGADALSRGIAGLLNADVRDAGLPLPVVALMAAVSLLAPLLATVPAIYRSATTTVLAALAGTEGMQPAGRLALSLEGAVSRAGVGVAGLALRGAVRQPRRLGVTLAALALVSALVIGALHVRAALDRALEEVTATFAFDVALDLGKATDIAELRAVAANVPAVREISPVTLVGGRIADDGPRTSLTLWGVEPATPTLHPTLLEGRWLKADDTDAVVITTYVQQARPGIGLGDTLSVAVRGKTLALRVVGVIAGVPTGVRPTPLAYLSQSPLAVRLGEAGKANRLDVLAFDQSAAGQQAAAHALSDALRQGGVNVPFFLTGSDLASGFRSAFELVVAALLLAGGLLAVVGCLGLAGAVGLSVLERSRELGVLRALGATSGTIRRLIVGEGLAVGLAGWAIGAVLGPLVGQALGAAVGLAFLGAPLVVAWAPEASLVWLVVLMPLMWLAALGPAERAARQPVRDVVGYA